jgi:hypothetical protein
VNRFRTIAVTAIAGFVLVACGPSASGSSGAGASQPPASQAAQASGGGPEPLFSSGVAADLEALIPDTIGGLTMDKSSMKGNEFLVSPDSDPSTVKFLQDLGISPNDVSMAFGFGFTAETPTTPAASAIMFVFRAAGADSGRLVSAFKAATEADASPLEWTNTNFGGKQVQTSVSGGATTYLYAKGDTLFFLTATDNDAAAQVIGDLP